jgi:hypothetical protein
MNETVQLFFSRVHTSWIELPAGDWLEEPEPIRTAVVGAEVALGEALAAGLKLEPLWDGDLDEPNRIVRAELLGYDPSFGAALATAGNAPPGISLRGLAVFVAVSYAEDFAASADVDALQEAREDLFHALVIQWRAGGWTFGSTTFDAYSAEPVAGETSGLRACSGVLEG